MSEAPLLLDGTRLTLDDVRGVPDGDLRRVEVSPDARRAMEESRAFVEERVAAGTPVYGVTTGFGRMAEKVITPEQRTRLQRNLIRSHAVGLGEPLAHVALTLLGEGEIEVGGEFRPAGEVLARAR